MVIEVEDFGGGGFQFNGEPVNGNGEPTLEELDPEVVKERIAQIKKYLPYLAMIGIVFAVKHLKKNGLAKSVDLVALSNVIQAFTPLITAVGWVLFTKVNDTARNLSFAFATAETIPAIDLNLPPGINLGSYFVVGDELLEMIPNAKDWLEKAGEEAGGLAEQLIAFGFDFLEGARGY